MVLRAIQLNALFTSNFNLRLFKETPESSKFNSEKSSSRFLLKFTDLDEQAYSSLHIFEI